MAKLPSHSMKDTIITQNRKKTELLIVLACFIAANLLNVFSIVCYGTEWVELITEMGFVVCVAVVLYVLTVVARLIICWLCRLICKNKKC